MTLQNRPQAQRTTDEASDVKRRSDMQPGIPAGYADQLTGDVRPMQGDAFNVWFKDLPNIDAPEPYRIASSPVIPSAGSIGELAVYPEIDVRNARLLTLYVQFTALEAASPTDFQTLSIFPENALVLEDGTPVSWFFQGVVNPTLYGSGLYGASDYQSVESESTAFRDCFVSQLNFTPWVRDPDGEPRNLQLTFDVSDKTLVRFRFGVTQRLAEGGEPEDMRAQFYYQLQR